MKDNYERERIETVMTSLEKLSLELELLELSMRRLKEILGGEKMNDRPTIGWYAIRLLAVALVIVIGMAIGFALRR